MMREIVKPARWLDVGGGHGHFCVAALDELPDTRFDGLDFSESIDEAKRRGWVDEGYRGLFPDLAPSMAGRYDAVSMSHYLEHTLDPRKELAAAHVALAPDGCLMIEVPDPEFVLGRVLRRFWLPWFQPQHQHLISVGNLERLLREHGFAPITWHRGAAHQKVDFFFAAWLVLDRLAPPRRLPWRWRGRTATAWRTLVWSVGSPLLLAGILIDNLIGPFFQRARVSNTYRVIARRVEPPGK
jgi:SAM-dependent methyltransferase